MLSIILKYKSVFGNLLTLAIIPAGILVFPPVLIHTEQVFPTLYPLNDILGLTLVKIKSSYSSSFVILF